MHDLIIKLFSGWRSVAIILLAVFLLAGCNSNPNEINSPEDITGTTFIGALSGTPSLRLADELGIAKSYFSAEEMMRDLRAAMIDCAIMEKTTATELVSDTSGVRILHDPLIEYELRFAIPMENAGLLDAVNTALEALGRDGTLRGITNKYFARRNFTYEPPEDTEMRQGYLTIALPSDSPPFSFKNDEGRFVGMDIEVATAVSDFLGVELRVIEYDAWELVTAVWEGRVDMALGWHPGEGEGIISTSEPYASAVQVIIVRK